MSFNEVGMLIVMCRNILLLMISSLFALNAFAGFVGPGAISTEVISVKEAADLADDSRVMLEGSIIKQIKHEHYLFKDDSGEMTLEIEDKDFSHITVTPKDKVRVIGEVDKDWSKSKLDVKHIELITY